jgi:hypothetical protein
MVVEKESDEELGAINTSLGETGILDTNGLVFCMYYSLDISFLPLQLASWTMTRPGGRTWVARS